MKGSCKNCNNKTVSYHWTIVRSDGVSITIDSTNSATGNGKPNLLIKPGVLASAFSYIIKMTITNTGANLEGYALIMLNAAPLTTSGIDCKIAPVTIEVLYDPVSITCTGAAASSTPNMYRISMKWKDTKNTMREMVMYRGLNPETKVYLVHMGSKAKSSVTVEVAMENHDGHTKLIKSR
jgi:hypothetical protein